MVLAKQQDFLIHVSELAGKYPSIPLSNDMKAQFGDDALFVTLPIGRVGARSRNGRTYTREAVQAIVDAVNKSRPEGRWGHLRDDERSTRYDPPAIRWLAAMLDADGMAWAKGIPVTAEAREHFRIAKIAGSKVGTSVYGLGQLDGDNVVAFELETIDLADPNRVGVPETAAEPMLTSEMDEDNDMTIELKDVPEAVRQQIIEQFANKQNSERVTEMESRISELEGQVTTLTAERDAARGEASKLLVTYAQAQIAEQVKLEPVQRVVKTLVGIREKDGAVTLEGASTIAEIDAAITAALEDESIKALNKDTLAELMGPDFKAPADDKSKDTPIIGTIPPF